MLLPAVQGKDNKLEPGTQLNKVRDSDDLTKAVTLEVTKNQRDWDTTECIGDEDWHSKQVKGGAKEENPEGEDERLIVCFVCGEEGRVLHSEPNEHISSLLSTLLEVFNREFDI